MATLAGVDPNASDGTTTASVLFTDLVGSTELRSRLGDEVADDLRRRHDETLTGVVTARGGRVVKSLGDGLMAVFDAAADAVAAAVAGQQAIDSTVEADGEPVEIRVGVSVGDVTFEAGDCHGTTVNEAARLCGAAQGGQILVADLVRSMTRGRGGFVFESVGELELKGLPEPVPACRVAWERLAPSTAAGLPFPSPLKPPLAGAYIGRPDVRLALSDLWDETKGAGARTALLVGEPGIGKTRTAYEVARTAHDEGAVVLFGRCDDEMRVPYQPFVEALAWQVRHDPALPLGRHGGDLTRLVPELRGSRPDLGEPIVSDARTEEHRLFEAIASWLIEVARGSGLVLVLDDLHWATKPTLLMLLHTVRAATDDDVRLLVVGTYRDTDLDRTHPLSAILGDLRRIDGVVRIPVDPLDLDEVIDFVEQAAGHPLDDTTRALAVRAHEETEGNPFFVAEVLRHLVEIGAVRFVDGRWVVPDPDRVDVPEGVRDVVGQRLSRLSDTANDVLRAAAVLGRDFELPLVSALAAIDEDAVLDALDDAGRARLVEETDADSFRFTHALVRTTLYEELSASRRRRMHRQVVDHLVDRHSKDLAALAHHAVEAGPRDGSLTDAIAHVLAAGEQAQSARAHAEAEIYFHKALELIDEDEEPRTSERRIRALVHLGESERDQGDPTFRETLLDAARRAADAGNDALLIRAALANTRGFSSIIGDIDQERIDILNLAVDRSSGASVGDQASLLVRMAQELVFDESNRARSLELADRGTALVREQSDPSVTAFVLTSASSAQLVPERWLDRVAGAREAAAAADASGDPTLRALAHGWLTLAHLCVADLAGARAAIDSALTSVDDGASPFAEWWLRGVRCQFLVYDGRLDDALAENDALLSMGERIGAPDAGSWWGAVAFTLGLYRDPAVDLGDQAGVFADQFPRSPAWRSAHIYSLASAGRLDEAREVVDRHDHGRSTETGKDMFWFAALFQLARAASILRDVDLGRRITEALAPHDGAGVHFCLLFQGTIAWPRAHAALAQGLLDEAVGHLRSERAWASANLTAYLPPIEVELAETLVERGGPGDQEEARALLAPARAEAERLGLYGWVTRADGALAALG